MSWLREPDAEPIPGYRLIEPLGAGGFGEVWKCLAPGELHKAIKFVFGNIRSEEEGARAEQEFRALQRVKEVRHRSVLSIERIDDLDGEIAIVMELADKSLHDVYAEYQARGRPGIPRAELLEYMKDAAEGLDYLNEHFNLQHLDVKPRNLFVMAGHVKVADFGLVKGLDRPSSAGMMGGVTPIYAAPETFSGQLSRNCDQYSLAVVYFELLTGRRPFSGKNLRQIALQHMSEPPDLAPLPEADRPAVARALAKDPAQRFPNCTTFVQALLGAARAGAPAGASADTDEEADLGQIIPAARPEGATPLPGEPPPTQVLPRVAAARPPSRDDLLPPPARATQPAIDVRGAAAPAPAGPGVRPTLFVGVGAFGLHALLDLRCRLLDRFGDLRRLPAFRFLYLDADPAAVERATAGTTEVVLDPEEVFALPLQPVGRYRQRMGNQKLLEHLREWLPLEKLYAMPRSLDPSHSRALGRLAFCDNFLRVQRRLRRELEAAALPEAVRQTAEATGLPGGETGPRAFVLASAVDGVSGLVPDLGYTLRKVIDQLHLPHAPTVAVLYGGAPDDPASPAAEQANLYATLTELNHYRDPGVSFLAQYGPDGPQLADHRHPFDGVYLTLRRERTPEAARQTVARVATFLAHDLATPLGGLLERRRGRPDDGQSAAPFRSFGTATVWYPRGLLQRVAARRACARLLEVWRSPGPATDPAHAEAVAAEAFADPGLHGLALLAALDAGAATPGEGTPTEATERHLAGLEAQAAAAEEPSGWTAKALERIREWAGDGSSRDPESTWKKSKFYRTLQHAAAQFAEQWDAALTARALAVLHRPGPRLAAGEAALRHLVRLCQQAVAGQLQQVERHHEALRPRRDALPAAQAQCGGGFRLFGGGPRALRDFLGLLGQFARQRVRQDLVEAALIFYRALQGRLEERVKDLGFIRQRLKALQQTLETPADDPVGFASEDGPGDGLPPSARDPFWEAARASASVEIVLPAGADDLEASAGQFTDALQTEHWLTLDEELSAKVLAPLGHLVDACNHSTNLMRDLGRPLVNHAAAYLGTILPITDVAQVQFSRSRPDELAANFARALAEAAPPLAAVPERQQSYLLVPDSEAGAALGRAAQAALPELAVVRTGALVESTFCREQSAVGYDELRRLLSLSRAVYEELAAQPPTSPHARFDVLEWAPLEP